MQHEAAITAAAAARPADVHESADIAEFADTQEHARVNGTADTERPADAQQSADPRKSANVQEPATTQFTPQDRESMRNILALLQEPLAQYMMARKHDWQVRIRTQAPTSWDIQPCDEHHMPREQYAMGALGWQHTPAQVGTLAPQSLNFQHQHPHPHQVPGQQHIMGTHESQHPPAQVGTQVPTFFNFQPPPHHHMPGAQHITVTPGRQDVPVDPQLFNLKWSQNDPIQDQQQQQQQQLPYSTDTGTNRPGDTMNRTPAQPAGQRVPDNNFYDATPSPERDLGAD